MKSKHLSLLCITIAGAFFVACQVMQPGFSDMSGQVTSQTIVPSEKGSYFYPVWLSGEMITFLAFPAGDNYALDPPNLPDLRFYNTKQNVWGKIVVIPDTACLRTIFDFMQRLPDHTLGFVESCLRHKGDNEARTIRNMNINTGESSTLVEPSTEIGQTGPFAFSPDMSELIEEDMTGQGLSNKLFYRKNNTIAQIAPGFVRVMHPAWSSHRRQIAFWGLESYPGKDPEELKTLSEMGELALYPLDLYVSAPEGTSIKKILSSVQGAMIIKWSPQDNLIAFSGTVGKSSGIWLIDPETSRLTRVWPVMRGFDFFDWSPDGKKMIVVNSDLDKNYRVIRQKLNIISLIPRQ